MRIVYDGKKAVKNLTGIGNYSRRCINGMAETSHADVIVLSPKQQDENAVGQIDEETSYVFPHGFWTPFYELWRNCWVWKVVKLLQADIFHGLSNEIPFGMHRAHCKTIVTIHDLIFLHYPQTYGWWARKILKIKTKYACKHADKIIAISECTKRDIMHYYHVPESKIAVIYQSINPIFFQPARQEDSSEVLRRLEIHGDYILSVGTIEQRKNQETLIKAVSMLPKNVMVVIVGKKTDYQLYLEQKVVKMHLEHQVRFFNNIPNEDLRHLYHRAKATVYMSVYEGFGLPVAEALASNCPVVAATGSCLEEAGGRGSIYINPYRFKELASVLNQLLAQEHLRCAMVEQGRKYVEKFKDEKMISQLWQLYEKEICSSK